MENNEEFITLSAKIGSLEAKIDALAALLSSIDAKLSSYRDILSSNGAQNISNKAILGANGVQNGSSSAFKTEIRKQERLDFRESVPTQLTNIMFFISERTNASSSDIKLQFNLSKPTYRRYINFLRKWQWVQLTPGAKRGNYVLSQKGKELMDKILLSK